MRGNRATVWWLASAFVVLSFDLGGAEVPQAIISNGVVKAKILLPDLERGYYRGVRFDWAGVVASLICHGHEYFGQWFEKYDPMLHDAIMGPVEEFRGTEGDGELGYAEAKPNGMFVKIGVGVLRKPDSQPYNFASHYQLINPGKRIVRVESDRVEFEHDLNDGEGYAYQYKKTLLLPRAKAQIVIQHVLKNTGIHEIDVDVYNHDFYMLDRKPTGPDIKVRFPFTPKPKDELKAPAQIVGNGIGYGRELRDGESAYGEITGFSGHVSDNSVRVENGRFGVFEKGDQPVSKVYFWSTKTTVCPEIYVHIHIKPKQTFKWQIAYEFYLIDNPSRPAASAGSVQDNR